MDTMQEQEKSADDWLKLTVRCPEIMTDPVSDLLGRTSGAGVEITPRPDGADISGYYRLDLREEENRDPKAARERIKEEIGQGLAGLFSFFDYPFPGLATETFQEQDWLNSWKQFFNTFEIIPGLVIKPSWEEYVPEEGQKVLEMDPGMAFGTGQHASTRLALSLIGITFRELTPPSRVLDVGTGTGILAMTAALFGAGEVLAIDNDPEAVRVARENIEANRLTALVTASEQPLAEIDGTFGLICANIVHDVLVAMAPDFCRLLAPGGRLVMAGILHGEQEKSIVATCASLGLTLCQAEYEQEWVALLVEKKAESAGN